jgi:hypothetical protein
MKQKTVISYIARLCTVTLVVSGLLLPPSPPLEAAGQQSSAYRWRNDDGTEATATWAAAESTALSGLAKESPIRLRVGMAGNSTDVEFTSAGSASVDAGSDSAWATVTDTLRGYLYTADRFDSDITRFDLVNMTTAGKITVSESDFRSAVVDEEGGFAYFGTNDSPGKIVKVDLSDFSYEDTLTLNAGEGGLTSAVIDTENQLAYFGTHTSPAKVVKVDLSTFTRVGVLDMGTVGSSERHFDSAVINPVDDTAYFIEDSPSSCGSNGRRVAKINVQPGNFAYVQNIITESAGDSCSGVQNAVIDTVNEYLYYATYTSRTIVKVDLDPFAFADSEVIDDFQSSGQTYTKALALDVPRGFLYIGGEYDSEGGADGAYITKLRVSDMTEVDWLKPATGLTYSFAGILKRTGYVYFLPWGNGDIQRIALADTENLRLEYAAKGASACDSGGLSWTQVPATATSEHFEMYDSSNLTHGLGSSDAAGLSNGSSYFHRGYVMDTASETARFSIQTSEWSEVEYSLQATSNATDDETYCFRLTDAGTPLAAYPSAADYPQATIGTGGGGGGSTDDPTLNNSITMSRLKIGVESELTVQFTLQNTLTGTLTVTFPAGFEVTGAPTSGSCSGGGTVDSFAYSSIARTITAEKDRLCRYAYAVWRHGNQSVDHRCLRGQLGQRRPGFDSDSGRRRRSSLGYRQHRPDDDLRPGTSASPTATRTTRTRSISARWQLAPRRSPAWPGRASRLSGLT